MTIMTIQMFQECTKEGDAANVWTEILLTYSMLHCCTCCALPARFLVDCMGSIACLHSSI